MSDNTPTNSPKPDQAGTDKPSRDTVKAERGAAKEAKRAAKAAAAAKKAGGEPGTAAAAGPSVPKKQQQQPQPQQAGVKKAQSTSVAASSAPGKADAGERLEGAPSKAKMAAEPALTHPTPSVLGGVSLFGNVSTSTHAREVSKHVVGASYRSPIHPSVLKLAQHLSSFTIVGADARAIAVLKALRDFVVDYRISSGAVFSRDLVTKLGPQIGFLVHARPLGASVGHAIRYLKYEISVTPVELNEEEVSSQDM